MSAQATAQRAATKRNSVKRTKAGSAAAKSAGEPRLIPKGRRTLDRRQRGHLRRILNLAAQLPEDWSGMMGRTTLQEDFGSYRFQLAYMAYALALTHIHRLPAAPGYFKRPFQRLIEKLRSPDVWTYWSYVSTGNGPINKAQGELPSEWNPVVKDNIMYSAYLQSVALLYHYVFDDDRYAQKNALSLVFQPLFWGSQKRFDFDEKSINEHLYWSMVERGYLGIACEPNCVFQICNQPAILGFRLHDLIYGGDTATEVTQGYLKAWSDFGVVNENGHFNMMVMEEEKVVVTPETPWADFWLGTMMSAWNSDFVKEKYPAQIARWAQPGPEGALWVTTERSIRGETSPPSARDFGWAAACASEVGDAETRDKLLAYADRHLSPTWSGGALHYPRRDEEFDADGLFRCMDPHTSNALIPYARLNVPDGLRMLYDGPLDRSHFEQPALSDLPENIDVVRAFYDPIGKNLALRLVAESAAEAALEFTGVWRGGAWSMRLGGETVAQGDAKGVARIADGVALRRDGDKLVLSAPFRKKLDLEIEWR